MILFLDFDGVMHPNHQPNLLFVRVPRLALWLEAWPAVDVVISSSWCVNRSQAEAISRKAACDAVREVASLFPLYASFHWTVDGWMPRHEGER